MRAWRWLVAGGAIAAVILALVLVRCRGENHRPIGTALSGSGSSAGAAAGSSHAVRGVKLRPRPPVGGLRLEGQVIDERDRPVAGATVRFYNFEGETVTLATADGVDIVDEEDCTIANVPPAPVDPPLRSYVSAMMRPLLLVLLVACGSTPAPQQPAPQPATAQPTTPTTPTTPEAGCPADLGAAVGTDCPTEGHACNKRAVQQATGLSNLIVCRQGTWTVVEVPPPAPN
jgi:hypothetical protein